MKKALLIGILYKGQDGELGGCVNDVNNIQSLLIEKFGFKKKNIMTLTDETKVKPTRRNLKRYMQKFANDAKKGDQLFFHY